MTTVDDRPSSLSGTGRPDFSVATAQARWRPDGKELFYVALDGRLMGVPIRLGDSVQASQPRPMFQTHVGGAVQGNYMQQYMVASSGTRFLMNTIPADSVEAPMILVLNWAGATRQ